MRVIVIANLDKQRLYLPLTLAKDVEPPPLSQALEVVRFGGPSGVTRDANYAQWGDVKATSWRKG